jgi:hypothetical protein
VRCKDCNGTGQKGSNSESEGYKGKKYEGGSGYKKFDEKAAKDRWDGKKSGDSGSNPSPEAPSPR